MNTPTDTEHGPGPSGQEPGPTGPRVTRDEVRDLGRLRRSRTDRKISGVAGGVARHLDVDPLLVRVAFVILTFFGGGGLILYGVAWLLVPDEHDGDAVINVDEGIRTAALIIAGVLTIASMVGDTFGGPQFPWPVLFVGLVFLIIFGGKQAKQSRTFPPVPGQAAVPPSYPGYRPGPPPPPRPVDPKRRGPLLFPFTIAFAALAVGVVATLHLAGVDVAPSTYPVTVLGVVGVMLLVGSFYGRAGGLIFIGLIAAVATLATSVVDNVDLNAGQTVKRPDTAAELASGYDVGIGEIIIDLTRLDAKELGELDGKTLDLEVGLGHIEVIVPDTGLRVDADAKIEAGEVILFGDKSENDDKAVHGGATEPTLTIDAELFLGQIQIHTETEKEAA
ncbi:PspC domain-containing protein [Nocardioides sp. WS12]|uniref:PspC domain-containing protein n=1 Tax=Nocardioides sp. WS12 TaxID=2486272 RepID=UPI0015FE54AE|nr:PspC domain-containing protein [Nocardioides sp. WS12]